MSNTDPQPTRLEKELFDQLVELETREEREAVHQLRLSAVWQLCPKILQEFSVGTQLTGAEFDPDGSRLLVATSLSPTQAVARVWNPFAGEPLTPAMEHSGTIHSVAWGAAGTRVVTASEGGTAKLWESRSGRLVMPPFRHTNGVPPRPPPDRHRRFPAQTRQFPAHVPGHALRLPLTLEQMAGAMEEHHDGEERWETAEALAERIVGKELARRGWRDNDLPNRPKGDPGKVATAWRLRKETAMTLNWIAQRLAMGSASMVSRCLRFR